MSSATDREYDLGDTVRRPISVAALLEREGFRPAARSRATRRALSGVTAGAVLALGAVVGSLFLNHGNQNTPGGTLAAGSRSGGDIVLAESSPSPGVHPRTARVQRTVPTATTHAKAVVRTNSAHVRVSPNRAVPPADTPPANTAPAAGQTQAAMQMAPASTTTPAPTTTTAPTGGTTSDATATTPPATTTTAPPATTTTTAPPPATTSPPAPPTTTTAPSGGLLSGVTGALDGVTRPVFHWFGG